MSAQDNKSRVARAIESFNRGDGKGYLEAYSQDCVLHGFPPQVEPNYEGLTRFVNEFLGGIPDARVELHEVVAEDDYVAARYTMRGTHQGPLLGAAPTGNRIEFEAMTLLRFDAAGRIAERWQRGDEITLLRQLGLLAALAQA